MYFSAIKRSIAALEEKKFYDVALLFLKASGYKGCSIVDGSGDGGRDVICERTDLRIQLSIRADWENKINSEAKLTKDAGNRHFIYITNKTISEVKKAQYFRDDYKFKGEVEVSIYDLNRVSSTLATGGVRHEACQFMGMIVGKEIQADAKQIALSSMLLFAPESKELRDDILEANIKAAVLEAKSISQDQIIANIDKTWPSLNANNQAGRTIDRLAVKGILLRKDGLLILSKHEEEQMLAAKEDYLQSIERDIEELTSAFSITREDAIKLIELSFEVLARDGEIGNEAGYHDELLLSFIAEKGIKQKQKLFKKLSSLSWVRVSQFGETLDRVVKTNTFDIYRALGRHSEIEVVLDSSVAMPMLFGLSFRTAMSRYGVAATELHRLAETHEFRFVFPRFYLNEVVHHGLKALNFIDEYGALPDDAKEVLRASKNAYLSHFSHIRNTYGEKEPLTLEDFLSYFGIRKGNSPKHIENTIESLMNSFGIKIVESIGYDTEDYIELKKLKAYDDEIIVKHDAMLVKLIGAQNDKGFIFVTWDRVLIKYQEGKTRVLADKPSRILDFLSMAYGTQIETAESVELLTALIFCDERKLIPVAQKIESIRSTDQAARLDLFARNERAKFGNNWELNETALNDFLSHDDEDNSDNIQPA